MFYSSYEEAKRLDDLLQSGVDDLTLEQLDKVLPNGYSIDDLTASEKAIVDFFLTALDEVHSELTEVEDNPKVIEKISAEIAESVLNEVKENLVTRARDIVVSLLDSKQ